MALYDQTILCCFVFLLSGAAAQSIHYPFGSTCAVKGSTVTLPCSFTPLGFKFTDGQKVFLKVMRVIWCRNHQICQSTTPKVYDSDNSMDGRFKYLGDMKANCTLQIRNVKITDEGAYRFRMEVNHTDGHFTNRTGVKLIVKDMIKMELKSSSGAREMSNGEKATLTCSSSCTFHNLKVTWFRNGSALSESSPTLQLGPLTAKDSGNYTCALESQRRSISEPYSLRVQVVDGGQTGDPTLIVGVVCGVLMASLILIFVLIFIKRKRAAAEDLRAVGRGTEKKELDNVSSSLPPQTEETSPDMQDISYASVHFKQKRKDRPAKEAEDAVIYSSVVSRG